MPSTVAHALVTFGTGLTLHALSAYRFTALHVFLLTLHATNGPDIGSVVEFLLSGIAPAFGTFFMNVVHSPLGYPFTLGLLWTKLGVFMSERDIRWAGRSSWYLQVVLRPDAWKKLPQGCLDEDVQERSERSLTFFRSWLITLAGALMHFRCDTIYENNGQDPLYKWILSTGYWLPGANDVIYPSVAIAFVCTLGGLLGSFAFIHTSLRTTLPLPLPQRLVQLLGDAQGRAIASAGVALCLAIGYVAFVTARLSIDPRIPAVGEEADLGVILFEAATGILPLVLCACSCPYFREGRSPVVHEDDTALEDRTS
ncbi:uncharacterized protein SPPG_02091 [Spizellomyces punctatus DAOM BR117]|uniref:Uncharacterized protein n=1 Tax=Spizellomyces punctatus (strain DAOM BR117) TaxID=645134 RepID=A0A0L0HPY3_SPIPD|nr:uncharacterized protein SPPG_02091 [Spizellomyces punctatus DAOM BR117]KND03020.1 hypothetical protein SPPG_02091 [Spizellomyces punctatus DAOM BR117]|eukprot:XP_016611059.1 hypothetical protein SPPG_02091 [Spizellomyces punctatus DAOM BR117]